MGVEPIPQAPEACTLSIELWAQNQLLAKKCQTPAQNRKERKIEDRGVE